MPKLYNVKQGEDADLGAVTVTSLSINGNPLAGGEYDLGGDTLIIDADADTTIDSATDDQLDITVGGTLVARLTAALVALQTGIILGGQWRPAVEDVTATGAYAITSNTGALVLLNNAAAGIAATLDAPTAGDLLILTQVGLSAVDHTVTLPGGVTFDGTNDVATFEDAGDTLVMIAISATRWLVLVNLGAVAFT